VVLGSEEKALAASQHLRHNGYWVPAVRYPTVAQGQARLRITINATHSARDLHALHHELQHLG
jgi:8-amino-7-oxononanoate synthase